MPYLLVVGTACLLIMLEPDMGTTMVVAFAVGATLIAAGARPATSARSPSSSVAVALLLTVVEPYRMARLTGFLNPAADTSGTGFQAAQAKIAIGSGGIFGVGIGNGVQKAYYLPEAHTDMISAVIGEELGLLGMLGIVGLFSMFGYAGLRVAQRAKDSYGKLLVAGLTSLILVQAAINLFAVMGLAPLTGVPLPFVSYGNSSLMATLFAVGLILNVARGASDRRGAAGSRLWRWQTARRRGRASHRGAWKESNERWQEAPRVVVAAGNRRPRRAGHGGRRRASNWRRRGQLPRHPRADRRPSWCRPPAMRSTSSRCAGSTAATRCGLPWPPRSRRWPRSGQRGGRCAAAGPTW